MIEYLKTGLASAAIALASGAALAADMYQPYPSQQGYYQESSGVYLRGDLGWSFLDSDIGWKNDDAFTIGAGLGYRFNNTFRGDLTVDYSGDYNVGWGNSIDAWTLLANGYVDIPLTDTVTPYLGAGIGYGWFDGSGGWDENGVTLAAMAGVAFKVNDTMAVDVGYRFRDGFISGPNFYDHSIRAGLRFGF